MTNKTHTMLWLMVVSSLVLLLSAPTLQEPQSFNNNHNGPSRWRTQRPLIITPSRPTTPYPDRTTTAIHVPCNKSCPKCQNVDSNCKCQPDSSCGGTK
ncbi:hypothetical protein Pmani_013931 [Petrolisthes manimaculis]|uniref:Uncharacterized protein n=1 Tax=Petrolisthes manimaculis TaxID=1843537 RepID=A0AAE1U962_9EUCA|nr:hypothetical protein Pmani_013931 [Petrolisthes manimaculis]